MALWRLPRPDFHRLVDTDFQDTPLSLRPDDLLAIPKMALSIGFKDSVSFLPAIQATRPLTLALVGLSPTERASLRLDAPRSVRISRTTRSCTLHDKVYEAYRAGAAAEDNGR